MNLERIYCILNNDKKFDIYNELNNSKKLTL